MDRFTILDRISKAERAEIDVTLAVRYTPGHYAYHGAECPLEMACGDGSAVANDELATYWGVDSKEVEAFTRLWDRDVISDGELLHELRVRGTHRE
jgi:hypothetical protein